MYEKFVKTRGIFYAAFIAAPLSLIVNSFTVDEVYEREVLVVPSLEEAYRIQAEQTLTLTLLRNVLTTPSQIFLDIVYPYSFKKEFIETYRLDTTFEDSMKMDDMVRALNKKITVQPMPSAALLIKVRDENKERAGRIAMWFVEFLDKKSNEVINVKGRSLRKFLEARIKEVEAQISALQDSIASLEVKGKFLSEAPADILGPAISSLLQNLAQKEIELSVMENFYSPEAAEVDVLRREIDLLREEIERRFSHLPSVLQKVIRYRLELELKGRIYALLYEEYERARIMEMKNTPLLQVVSEPGGFDRKVWPKRVLPTLATATGMFFSYLLLLTFFLVVDRLEGTEIGRIIRYIRKDLGS